MAEFQEDMIFNKINDIHSSTKRLCFGIEWLLVDKFVKRIKKYVIIFVGWSDGSHQAKFAANADTIIKI